MPRCHYSSDHCINISIHLNIKLKMPEIFKFKRKRIELENIIINGRSFSWNPFSSSEFSLVNSIKKLCWIIFEWICCIRFYFRSDGTDLPILEEQEDTNSDKPKQPIKYGELVILGWVIEIVETVFSVYIQIGQTKNGFSIEKNLNNQIRNSVCLNSFK